MAEIGPTQLGTMLIVASLWYLVLVSVASFGQSRLEKRLARGFGGASRPAPQPGAAQ